MSTIYIYIKSLERILIQNNVFCVGEDVARTEWKSYGCWLRQKNFSNGYFFNHFEQGYETGNKTMY
jgi:hypothetical protein